MLFYLTLENRKLGHQRIKWNRISLLKTTYKNGQKMNQYHTQILVWINATYWVFVYFSIMIYTIEVLVFPLYIHHYCNIKVYYTVYIFYTGIIIHHLYRILLVCCKIVLYPQNTDLYFIKTLHFFFIAAWRRGKIW